MTGAKLSLGLRWPMLLGFVSLLVLVGGFGSWATFSSLSGAIIASGQIEVEKNRQVVQHPDGGVVAKILVKEGDFVPTALTSEVCVPHGELATDVLPRHLRIGVIHIERPENLVADILVIGRPRYLFHDVAG